MQTSAYARISNILTSTVCLIGFISVLALLSGDAQGRVNLLYLLLLFVIWPLITMLLLITAPLFRQRNSLTRNLVNLPLWPYSWREKLFTLQHQPAWHSQIFYLAQKLALGFSLACSFALLFSLLFSDINFVWRSTLLSGADIYPLLKALSLPWWFADAAQPLQSLLEQTRDSRLVQPDATVAYGAWWPFLLMAQLCYGVLPRIISLFWARHRLQKLTAKKTSPQAPETLKNLQPETPELTDPANLQLPLPAYNLLYWNQLPSALQSRLQQQLGKAENCYSGGAAGSLADEQTAIQAELPLVVVIAAWEPPMGELADLLEESAGYLLPLDWHGETASDWQPVSEHYLDEWRRFCEPLPGWQLIQPALLLSSATEHSA